MQRQERRSASGSRSTLPATGGRPETLSGEGSVVTQGVAPDLFLVVNSDRPLEKSLRLSLLGIDQVTICRAAGEFVSSQRTGAGIELLIADPWMSTVHATLRRLPGGFCLEDNGSRNGKYNCSQ